VLFEPENMRLLTGSPDLRREFIDDILTISDPQFGSIKKHYIRALQQRNSLLKQQSPKIKDQIFVWNKLISEQDKKIIVTISFPKMNESDFDINPIHLELLPGVWNIRDYQEQISGRKVVVEYSYEQDDDIVSDTKIYYI
jgi:hypothetical protein